MKIISSNRSSQIAVAGLFLVHLLTKKVSSLVSGQTDPWVDSSSTARQTEVESVWETLLQVPYRLYQKNISLWKQVMCCKTMFLISAALMMLLYWSFCRLLMLVYLLYISIFTVCCINRPLKDIPENYTKADNDQTIKVQKSLTVWNINIFMFLCIKALLYMSART